MSDNEQPALREIPPHPNPYSDDAPLVVRDRPMRENRGPLLAGALVIAAPLIWLLVRLLSDLRPVLTGQLILALVIAVPLGLLMILFPIIISSGTRVTLGATTLRRAVREGRGTTKTVSLEEIRGGIYAFDVQYRRDAGAELVLFLPEGDVLWIADGITPPDIERIAHALSAYGIKEYADPITNEKLQALIGKARRAVD